MGLDRAEFRHRHGADIETDGIILVIVEIVAIAGEQARLEQQVGQAILRRKSDPALETEGVGIAGALDKAGVIAARQFLQPLEIIVLARGQRQPAMFIGEKGVGQLDIIAGKIRFQLVAEAARDRARGTQPDAPRLAGKAKTGVDDAVRCVDGAGIDQDAAARLEAPAVFSFDLRCTLERDLGRLLLRQLLFGRGNLRIGGGNRAGRELLVLPDRAQLRLQIGDLALQTFELAQQCGGLFLGNRRCHSRRRIERHRCGTGQQTNCLEHRGFHQRACLLRSGFKLMSAI